VLSFKLRMNQNQFGDQAPPGPSWETYITLLPRLPDGGARQEEGMTRREGVSIGKSEEGLSYDPANSTVCHIIATTAA